MPPNGNVSPNLVKAFEFLSELATLPAKEPEDAWIRCQECGANWVWDEARDIACCPICKTPHPEDA